MDTAERLSSLVEQGHLIVSRQFGHQGKDSLYAPPAAELKGDGIVNAGAGDDHLYANNEGSKLRRVWQRYSGAEPNQPCNRQALLAERRRWQ